jgi:hypothetical protein
MPEMHYYHLLLLPVFAHIPVKLLLKLITRKNKVHVRLQQRPCTHTLEKSVNYLFPEINLPIRLVYGDLCLVA